jgi:oligopeptide/dipeptide ABC transporter ATP-binding protein
VVDGVSFEMEEGERLALVGESGSGKTVTALAIMGLVDLPGRIVEGSVRIDGRDVVGLSEQEYRALRGRDVAIVFQEASSALNPSLRIGDLVAEAVVAHDPVATSRSATARASALLERVGVTGTGGARARDYPHQLSGGMRQRVVLAAALANRPRLLIADEPTTALDATTQSEMLALLDDLRRDHGLAVLFITHDLAVVGDATERVVVMYAGRVVEAGPTAVVLEAPSHPYTRALLAASPRLGAARGALAVIPGQPPSARDIPPGCAFHPRCGFAESRCTEAVPTAQPVGDAHSAACVRVHELPAAELTQP